MCHMKIEMQILQHQQPADAVCYDLGWALCLQLSFHMSNIASGKLQPVLVSGIRCLAGLRHGCIDACPSTQPVYAADGIMRQVVLTQLTNSLSSF